MDRPKRNRGRVCRANDARVSIPPPPPPVTRVSAPPPPPPPPADPNQLFALVTNMMNMMQQQQQQNQQFLIQQQQQFAQQAQAGQAQAGQVQARQAQAEQVQAGQVVEMPIQAREVRLPEFAKLAPDFDGKSLDPVVAKNQVTQMEKTFKAFNVSEAMKMPLAEFQLKATANDWQVGEKAGQQAEWTQMAFKGMFYKKYFPQSTRDEMLSRLWTLK